MNGTNSRAAAACHLLVCVTLCAAGGGTCHTLWKAAMTVLQGWPTPYTALLEDNATLALHTSKGEHPKGRPRALLPLNETQSAVQRRHPSGPRVLDPRVFCPAISYSCMFSPHTRMIAVHTPACTRHMCCRCPTERG